MADDIELKCRGCKRTIKYPRSADLSIPARVVKIVQGSCDRCWGGDHDDETWFDANGLEVDQRAYAKMG